MAFPGAGIAEQDDRLAGVEVGAGGEGGDGGRVDAGGGGQVEVGQAFYAREPGFLDSAPAAVFGAGVDLGGEDLGQVGQVGPLAALGQLGQPAGFGAHDGHAQFPGGRPDGGGGGVVGHLGVHADPSRSWS